MEPTWLLRFGFVVLFLVFAFTPSSVLAWGGEGHAIIALIADQLLDAEVRAKVAGILSADTDDLAGHDIASASMWADRYRDSDRHGSQERFRGTREWHFVDIEIEDPDLARACFGYPPLPAGLPASRGPSHACIVDKINQFVVELSDPATNAEERLIALKFLLHRVGDVHQPLHAADDHDAGGNGKAGLAQKTCISFGMSNWSSSLGAIRNASLPTSSGGFSTKSARNGRKARQPTGRWSRSRWRAITSTVGCLRRGRIARTRCCQLTSGRRPEMPRDREQSGRAPRSRSE